MKRFPTLYKRTSNGSIQQWTIIADGDGYYTEEGIVDGKLSKSASHTCEAKNPGKKNETTAASQALKESKAKWDKNLKRGYSESVDTIDEVTFTKPMKGDKWIDRQDEVVFPGTVQNKLNGVRFQNVKDRAYSTGGETFHTIPHIREELAELFEEFPDAFIDGEAFNPELKKSLNQLIKLVSVGIKPKDLTPELLAKSKEIVQFHVFDGYGFNGITKDTPFIERHAAVKKLIKSIKAKSIFVVDYEIVKSKEDLFTMLKENKKEGGEGLMFRWGKCEYKNGRSKYMLKLKHFDDAEYEVVDVQEGNADWKGAAKRIVLKLPKPCKDRDGNVLTTFAANIEGDREWLTELFKNKKQVIGEKATTEYQQLSEYGIPQIPWVRAIRNYE